MEKAWLFVALVLVLIIATESVQGGPPFREERVGKRSTPKVMFHSSILVIFFLQAKTKISSASILGQRLKKKTCSELWLNYFVRFWFFPSGNRAVNTQH